jgi:hypothetical protein
LAPQGSKTLIRARANDPFCRRNRSFETPQATPRHRSLKTLLNEQVAHLERAGLQLSYGDRRCLIWGLVAEETVKALRADWRLDLPIGERMAMVSGELLPRAERAWEANATTRAATPAAGSLINQCAA